MEPADSPPADRDAPLAEMDDAELVAALAAGSQPALAELYDRYSAMLLGLAHRVLGNGGDAEEILQEAFLQAWKQAERYQPSRSSVSTWLVLITRSRAIDRLRSRHVVQRTVTAAGHEKGPAHASPEGMRHVLTRERRQRLRTELERLPEAQRQVLELAFYQGMTQSEIAGQTGIPLGTVKTRTLLGVKKLRQALEADIEELL